MRGVDVLKRAWIALALAATGTWAEGSTLKEPGTLKSNPRLQLRHHSLTLLLMPFMGFLLLASFAPAEPVAPDCDNPQGEAERTFCRLGDLRTWDGNLNVTYRGRMEEMDATGKARLRGEQRAWTRERNAACRVESKPNDRGWLQAVAKDAERTDCVVRVTRERTQVLRDDPRHEYDLVQVVRATNQDIVFSVKIHPRLPRSIFRVVWKPEGATNSSRGKLIDRIEVSREDAAGGMRLLTGHGELEQPIYTPTTVLRADDVNFDGYLDVGILAGVGHTGNMTWVYWLYKPRTGQFEAQDDLELADPSFDPKTRTIKTGAKCGGGCFSHADYKWRNGRLVLIDEGVFHEESE